MFKPDWPTVLSSNFGNSVATNQFFLSPPILATLLPQLFFFFFFLLQFSAIATIIPINFFALLFPYNFSNSTILFFSLQFSATPLPQFFFFSSNFRQLHCHKSIFFLTSFLQFRQLHCHKYIFFSLYSNFSNLVATIPIKFFLSSPTISATWLPQLLFPSRPLLLRALL